MKKSIIFLLCASLLTGFSFAEEISSQDITTILTGMEIISGSEATETSVTREMLAKTLVNASEYASMAKAQIRMSPFSDVDYSHPSASYIRLAAMNGYMTAYSNGEFKPDNVVTNEEAITAVLKLLGYKNSDFTQSYPYEQLMIAKNMKLTDGVDTTIGTTMTIRNLQRLIYNALTCTPKTGNKSYVETLGYTLSTGNITLGDVMSKNISGPLTYKKLNLTEATGLTNPTVYINGKLQSESELGLYDILYYSENSNTVWAYREKASGMVESISPNREAPTAVTISGKSYKLTSYSAQKAFSIDGFTEGNMVTLLLDRNGEVSDVYLTETLYTQQVGVIISAGKKDMMQATGTTKISYYATVLLATGEKVDVATGSDYSKKVGYTAKITYKNGKATVSSTTKATEIYGTFSVATNKIGTKYAFTSEVKILEVDSYGNTKTIYPSRLDGVYLNKNDIAMIEKNSAGVIESMIIKDVTGDTANYGIVTGITERADSDTYAIVINGNEKNYSNSSISFNVEEGPAIVYMEGQSLGSLKNLIKVDSGITDVDTVKITTSKGETMKVSSDVVVYFKDSSSYNLSTMDEAMSGEHYISAYYDCVEKDGGRIRVIILS